MRNIDGELYTLNQETIALRANEPLPFGIYGILQEVDTDQACYNALNCNCETRVEFPASSRD